jgi:hypothetical protein
MAITFSEGVALGAVALSVGTYLWNRFGTILEIQKQLGVVDSRLAKLEMKMDTLWPAVTDAVKNLLMQTHAHRKDELLRNYPHLAKEDLCELQEILIKEKECLMPNAENLPSDQKVYLMALGLMLGGIMNDLLNLEEKC